MPLLFEIRHSRDKTKLRKNKPLEVAKIWDQLFDYICIRKDSGAF